MASLQIYEEKRENAATALILSGGIDAFVVSKLKDSITKLVDNDISRIIIDLGDVTQINSTALGVIIGRLRKVRSMGGDICIVRLNEKVRNIFDIMGASKVFKIFDTVDEAVNSFSEDS